MVANEPYQVGKVGYGCLVDNEPQHGLIVHFVDVKSKRSHRNTNHRLAVMEEFDGLRVQREIICVLKRGKISFSDQYSTHSYLDFPRRIGCGEKSFVC